jgi:protein TonB
MRIDRYVHDERLTWGAAGVLLAVAAVHAGAIARLFLVQPEVGAAAAPAPVFQVSLQKLPPLRPPEPETATISDAAPPPTEETRPPPRQTRPVPILVDTPVANPVPVGTQVKPYEIGDELLPGVPGPPVTGGTPDGVGFDDSPRSRAPIHAQLRLVSFVRPEYPPRCIRREIEGRVLVGVLVGEDGRPQEVAIRQSSGDSSLDESALQAVMRWRFEAAMRNGVPVRAWAIAPVEFKLIR